MTISATCDRILIIKIAINCATKPRLLPDLSPSSRAFSSGFQSATVFVGQAFTSSDDWSPTTWPLVVEVFCLIVCFIFPRGRNPLPEPLRRVSLCDSQPCGQRCSLRVDNH